MTHRFPDEPEITIETTAGQEVIVNPEGSSLKLSSARLNKDKTQARIVTAGTFAAPDPDPEPPPPPPPPPDPDPTPEPPPADCTRVATAPTNGSDATAGLNADIAATPNGGTLCLVPDATYTFSGEWRVENRTGITINGRNALLKRPSESNTHLLHFQGGSGHRVTNLRLDGANTQTGTDRPAIEYGHGISIYGTDDVTIDNVTTSNTTGDAVYIAGGHSPSGFQPADRITITKLKVNGTGRMGVAITDGGNFVTITNCEFFNVAGYAFDIEPNGHPELGCPAAHDVVFRDNVYHSNTQGQHIGVPKVAVVSTACPVDNLQIVNNRSVGSALRFSLGDPRGTSNRLTDVLIQGNIGESSSSDYPIELRQSDRVQILNNVQPLRSGQPLVSQSGCTAVTISGNT